MDLSDWMERYCRAWETADVDDVISIFTADAVYHSSVFREPHVGRDGIAKYWSGAAGAQTDVKVKMGRPVITQNRVVVEWWTTMTEPERGKITLPGAMLLRFNAEGLCCELWEYWMIQEGWHSPPEGWGQ